MPAFAILCHDRSDAGSLRADTRPRHLEHLETIREATVVAGPMLDSDGVAFGSIIIAEFPDLAAAEAFARADPYAAAGLFRDVTVSGWRQVVP